MIRLLTCLVVLLAIAPAARAQEESLDARITSLEGSVTIYTADDPEGAPGEVDMPLAAGDKIVTGSKGRVEFGLDGESVVELGPNTQFTIASLERKTAAFDLGLGTLIAKIKTGLFGQGGELDVRTPSAVAAVRGTEFGAENTADGGAHFGVFDEGKVSVRGASGGEVLLTPNQETSVLRGQRPQAIRRLQRFAGRRRRLLQMRRRIAVIRKRWAKLPPARRQELRQRFIQRRRALRQGGRIGPRNRRKTMREILEERRRRNQK